MVKGGLPSLTTSHVAQFLLPLLLAGSDPPRHSASSAGATHRQARAVFF